MSEHDHGKKPKRGLSPVAELIREALKHEKNTAEGITNMVTLALIVVALIAGPIISGTVLRLQGDEKAWSVELHMGDVTGGLAWLVLISVICLVFVGGTNYLRDRGRQ